MEHLIVKAVGKYYGNEIKKKASVIINGQRNGKIGQQMQLEEGFVMVSVDLPGAETNEVDLFNTTPTKPMEVEVRCDEV